MKDTDKVKKGSRHDFLDYAFSKEVVRDFPKLLVIYNQLIPVLEKYRQYTGAVEVLSAVYDCKTLLEIQLTYYKRIYDKKGKITDEQK